MRKKAGLVVTVLTGVLFIAATAHAEEEIGLVQRLWRKFFKKPAATEQKKIEQDNQDKEITIRDQVGEEELTEEERQAQQDLLEELEQMRGQRQLLEDVRRAQDAQRQTQNARPPR